MLVLILSLGRFHLLWRLRRSTLGHACLQNSSWRYSHITSNNLTAFVDLVICGISARSLGHGTASSLPWAWRPITQSTNSLSIAPTFSTMEPVYDSHLWRMASSLETYGLKCGALCLCCHQYRPLFRQQTEWMAAFLQENQTSGYWFGVSTQREASRLAYLFPSVRNLALFISLDDAERIGKFCTCGSLPANLHVLNNWLGTAEFELQAENVEVSIFNENRLKSVGNQNCQCTKATENIIKKMATRVKGGPRLG
jgi:hypothetical protein